MAGIAILIVSRFRFPNKFLFVTIMFCFEDNYEHLSPDVFYIEENIPGPMNTEDPESVSIYERHNSQVTRHCECSGGCTLANKCPCITKYGGDNYITHEASVESKVTLNEMKVGDPIFECNSLCFCANRPCGNRLIQYGPRKNLEIKNTDLSLLISKGCGVFTSMFVPKGTFVCEYAGEVITKSEALKRHRDNTNNKKMNYIFCLNEHTAGNIIQTFVDPSKFGNIGRYINHSCRPNCCIVPVRVDSLLPKLSIFSVVGIAAGSEITFDYGSCSVDADSGAGHAMRKQCLCGSDNCRMWLPCERYC